MMVSWVFGAMWERPKTQRTYEKNTMAAGLAKVNPRSGSRRKSTKAAGRAKIPMASMVMNQ